VNLVHFDDQWACILDNNFIGENDLVWMSPPEFLERWRGKGSGWVVILLREPPETPATAEPRRRYPRQLQGDEGPARYLRMYHRNDPYRVYLYCDGETVGAYDFREHYFRFYAAH